MARVEKEMPGGLPGLGGFARLERRMMARVALAQVPARGALPDTNPFAVMPPARLAMIVRGLADVESVRAGRRHTDKTMVMITALMPEAPFVLALHRHYRARHTGQVASWARVDIVQLHRACHDAHPVRFRYVDRAGRVTWRQVLPGELVQAGRHLMLLAHCGLRAAPRMFDTRSMSLLRVVAASFAARRADVLLDAIEQANRFYDD